MPMTGFELRTSGIGSDRSTHWATTITRCITYFYILSFLSFFICLFSLSLYLSLFPSPFHTFFSNSVHSNSLYFFLSHTLFSQCSHSVSLGSFSSFIILLVSSPSWVLFLYCPSIFVSHFRKLRFQFSETTCLTLPSSRSTPTPTTTSRSTPSTPTPTTSTVTPSAPTTSIVTPSAPTTSTITPSAPTPTASSTATPSAPTPTTSCPPTQYSLHNVYERIFDPLCVWHNGSKYLARLVAAFERQLSPSVGASLHWRQQQSIAKQSFKANCF